MEKDTTEQEVNV